MRPPPVHREVRSSDGRPLAALRTAAHDLAALLDAPGLSERLDELSGVLIDALASGGKILLVGNGGSCCDAAHFAEELTGRYRADRRPLPALACNDPGHLTCTANDYGFEQVFARWVAALARPGDVLILLSTSGQSANLLLAADAARAAGVRTCALLGKDGGALRQRADWSLIVPGATSDRIQELHMLILHAMVEAIEVGLGLAK